MRRRRKRLDATIGQATLFAVGPYAGLTAPSRTSLPNGVNISQTFGSEQTRTNPIKYNNISINSLYADWYTWDAIFLWADTVSFQSGGGIVSVIGINSVDESPGVGGSGGGGYGSFFGGTGGNGDTGQSGFGAPFIAGGFGSGRLYQDFTYNGFPIGGQGGQAFGSGAADGGAGISGAGGGGGGADDGGTTNSPGAGGAGLFCSVSRIFLGANGFIYAYGGESETLRGGGGGGGSIEITAQKYDGLLTVFVNGGIAQLGGAGSSGNAAIFELSRDGRTRTLRAFNQSWDNTN